MHNNKQIKFNLNKKMAKELLEFNNIKKELNELNNLDKNDITALKIKDLEYKLKCARNNFIKEFRINNLNEINEYLGKKD